MALILVHVVLITVTVITFAGQQKGWVNTGACPAVANVSHVSLALLNQARDLRDGCPLEGGITMLMAINAMHKRPKGATTQRALAKKSQLDLLKDGSVLYAQKLNAGATEKTPFNPELLIDVDASVLQLATAATTPYDVTALWIQTGGEDRQEKNVLSGF